MIPPPAAPPTRVAANTFHYHVYDYPGSAARGRWGLSDAQPTRGGYQFHSMVQSLAGLRDYGVYRGIPNMRLDLVGGPTAEQRRTLMLSFGRNTPGTPAVVITGGIHAREWIATEMAYLIAEFIVKNHPAAPPPVGLPPVLTQNQTRLRDLVNTRHIRIIPMVNPDGNRRTVFGDDANDRYWRKNCRSLPNWGPGWLSALAPNNVPNPPFTNVSYQTWPIWAQYRVPNFDPTHGNPAGLAPPVIGVVPPATYQNHVLTNLDTGVDLNRNMDTRGWGYDPPRVINTVTYYLFWNPAGDQFFGTNRGGEPETGNVQTAMTQAAQIGVGGLLDVTIDYHCYGMWILYPGETANNPLAAQHASTGVMLQNLIRTNAGAGGYALGHPLGLTTYEATGTVADYAQQRHTAKSFTIELDPAVDPDPTVDARLGFALNEDQIKPVFAKNIRGALAAIAAPTTQLEATNYQADYGWNMDNQGNQLP